MTARHRSPLPIVYTIVFLAFFDTFALLPTVGPYAASLGADAVGVGTAVAAYSLTSLVFNVVGGLLLDRVGRKPLAVLGLVGAAAAVALYPLATTATVLIAVRLIHGAAGGLLVPALFTLAGDLSEAGARGRTMGRAGAFIGAAAVVGPGVAGPLRSVAGFDGVFLLIAAVLATGAVLAAAFVRETVVPVGSAGTESSPPTAKVLGRRELLLAFGAVFGFTAAFGTLAAFLPGAVEALGAGPAVSGGLFALVSVIAAALMISPAARWVDRSGVVPAVRAGMALFVSALGTLVVSGTVLAAVVASIVFGLGFGLLFPAATGAVAIAAPLRGRGRAFGFFNAAYSLGFIVGAPLAGIATRLTGASPYLAPSVICLVVLVATSRRR
jgi:MFS transporter, DHA1 family, multidrug resistance protein